MAITWTIIVLGALLLHDMQCDSSESIQTTLQATTNPISSTTSNPSSNTSPNPALTTSSNPTTTNSPNPTTLATLGPTTPNSMNTTTLTTSDPKTSNPLNPTTITSSNPTTITSLNPSITTSLNPTNPTSLNPSTTISQDSTPTIISHPDTSLTSLTTEEPTQQPRMSDSPQVTTQIQIQPTTTNTKATPTPSLSQETTSSNKPAITTHEESGTTPVNQADTSTVFTNPAPDSTSAVSQAIQSTEAQATSASIASVDPATSTSTSGNITHPVFKLSDSIKGNFILETCKMLGQKMKGNCSVTLKIQDNQLIATVKINADQKIPIEIYRPSEQKGDVSEQTIPDTLIAILASSGALVLILCCFAAYCTYHRRSYRKNQQHLTEEMQTVENGYHDNPTLEVMEVQPEMQEKKLALNGEFNDSWIVPIDNLLKEDIPDEEDTHL